MIRTLFKKIFSLPKKVTQQRARILAADLHPVRREHISSAALKVVERLQQNGFLAYIVGGAVRDVLLGIEPKDFDVATNATPEEVHHLFRRSYIIGRRFRIVHVVFGAETIEVTTFRGGQIAHKNETGRIMADNNYGSLQEDAFRRDFTVNALFFDPFTDTIIDYHDGVKDVAKRRLVMIGDAAQRYQEDPVRMLRAVRLSAKLGLSIDEATRQPIRQHVDLLKREPAARLFDEILKLLLSGQAYACLTQLRKEGLSYGILPLLDTLLGEARHDRFLELSLCATDERIRQDKPVSVGFLLATLLWREVHIAWVARQAKGELPLPALTAAIAETEAKQGQEFAIPRRFSVTMREIWLLQTRFSLRKGQRPFRLITQPRFRAAFDFLALRAEVGEEEKSLVAWWEAFRQGDDEKRRALMISLEQDPAQDGSAHKRQRRRRSKNQPPPPT